MNDDRLTKQLMDAADYCLETGNRYINEIVLQQIHQPCEGKYCKKCKGCNCHMGGTLFYPSENEFLELIRLRFPDVFDEQCSGCEGCFLDIQVQEEEFDKDSLEYSIPSSFRCQTMYIIDSKYKEFKRTMKYPPTHSVEYYAVRRGEGLKEILEKAKCKDAAIFGGYANPKCKNIKKFEQMDGWRLEKSEVLKMFPAFSKCPKKCEKCAIIIALFF